MKISKWLFAGFLLVAAAACKNSETVSPKDYFRNPISTRYRNTSMIYDSGIYYYIVPEAGHIALFSSSDASCIFDGRRSSVLDYASLALANVWHPQLVRLDDAWYIYLTADDGETDNHRLHVFRNASGDPHEGEFRHVGRLVTDKDDTWAIHPYVFRHNGELYMTWSGWETRRVFAETQCIYIAKMASPTEFSSERVIISRPEHEWEIQWINRDGSSYTRYPVFVNEAPFFFCNDDTDKAYIYYSASANWTSYICIGELSAEKDADLLDPASWTKKNVPVFEQNREAGIFGPEWMYIIPSKRVPGNYYMVYSVMDMENRNYRRDLFMQKISIENGHPVFGKPISKENWIEKP